MAPCDWHRVIGSGISASVCFEMAIPTQKHLRQRACPRLVTRVQSVALQRNPANAVVVLAVVLGSRDVEILATNMLTIRGQRASRLAQVRCEEAELCVVLRIASINILDSLPVSAATTGVALVSVFDTFCCFNDRIFTDISATSLSAARSINGCPKCGNVSKSRKRSCCAHGGAWFKNCGDTGDTKFDHTWTEGMQACTGKDFASSVLVKSLPVMLHRMGEIGHPANTTQSQMSTYQHADIYRSGSTFSNAVTGDSEDCVRLAKVVFTFFCLSF